VKHVWLTPRAHADLLRARERAQPLEACGLLVGCTSGDRTQVLRAVRLPNRARDPKRFSLCPTSWMRVEGAARRLALTIVGPWHTHPDQTAQPSQLDYQHGWPGRPNLIVGCDGIRGWVQAETQALAGELRIEFTQR